MINIDIEKLRAEYLEWCKEKSTPGYVYGTFASNVFEFLYEKKIKDEQDKN